MKGITILEDGQSVLARVKTKIRSPEGAMKDRVQKKTFRGGTLDENLERARAWRVRIRGEASGRDLPEGIRRVRRATGFALVATVPTWADERRPSRTFPEGDLDRASEWLERATAARAAGLPLPKPDAARESLARKDPGPQEVVLLGVAGRRWLDRFYGEKVAAGKVSSQRVRSVTSLMERFIVEPIGAYRLDDISAEEHLTPLIEDLAARRYSRSQQKLVIWVLRSIFKYAISQGWCTRNPAALLHDREPASAQKPVRNQNSVSTGYGTQGRTRPPAHPKRMAIVLGRIGATYGIEIVIAVALERYMGVRISESLAPTLGDIDRFRQQLRITKQRGRPFESVDDSGAVRKSGRKTKPKTAAGTRVLPIPDFLWGIIEEHLDARVADGASPADPLLACSEWSEQGLGSVVRRALAACSQGLLVKVTGEEDWYRPHDLRHQYESDLFNAGIPDVMQSYLLGHNLASRSDAAAVTLRTYLHDYQEGEWERDPALLTDFDRKLRDAARDFNDYIVEALEGQPLIARIAPASPPGNWMPVAEAAEILGCTKTRVYQMISAGLLTATHMKPTPGFPQGRSGRRSSMVVCVDQVKAAAFDNVPVPEISRVLQAQGFQIHTATLIRVAESEGIAVGKHLGEIHTVKTSDMDRLCQAAIAGFEFKATHWPARTAAKALGISLGLIQRAEALRIIHGVDAPPAALPGHARIWYPRQELADRVAQLLPPAKQARFAAKCLAAGLRPPGLEEP